MPVNDAPLFDWTLEVAADKLEDHTSAYSRKHVSATPKMCWPFNSATNVSKYSFFTEDGLQFEVDFSGNITLDFDQLVLLCLKGVKIIPRPTLKHPKLPFKLAFPEGVILKVGERIMDTFPEVSPPLPVPSWFTSQPSPPSISSPRRVDSPILSPSRQGSSPNQQSSHQPDHEPPVDHRSPMKQSLTSFSAARPPSQTLSYQSRIDVARTGKRPRQSTEEFLASNSHPGSPSQREDASNFVQAGRPGISSANDLTVQGPKKKRRRRDKKSLAKQSHVPARNPALDMIAGFWSSLAGPYISLADTTNKLGSKISVVGIVRGISIPKMTRHGDWSVTTELLDPSTTEQTAFVINLFLPEPLKDCIPNVKAGDILMLLKITVVQYSGKVRGTGYPDTFQWAGYSPTQKVHFHSTRRTFSDEDHCPFFTPGEEELQYAAQLTDWWTALQDLSRSKPGEVPKLMSAPKGRSLITLSEAKPDVFFNCIVEVLYTSPPGDQFAEIFITDYTVHPQFFTRRPRDNEKQEQTKVYGKRVLKVLLWGGTQLEHVRELETPCYCFIDNLRIKFDSKGHLEGTLQDNKRKIDKLRKDDPLLADLLKRKQEYIDRPPSPDIDVSRRELASGRDFNLHSAGDLLPPPVALPPNRVEAGQQGLPVTRLLYYNIVRTPIQKVLGHPSCPEIFRVRARIAAFEPYKLENFSQAYCTRCNTDLPPRSMACHDCADSNREYVAYQYRFRICIEEETTNEAGYRASLIVDVTGKEAETFLSGVPPVDFWDVKNARRLRERLTPVLGNLEAYQCDMATGNSLKALMRGQYFDLLIQSHRSAHKSESALDNKRYRLWGTELLSTRRSD